MLDALDNPQEEPVDENAAEDTVPQPAGERKQRVLKTIRADRTPEAGMEKEIQAWRIPLRDCRSRSYMIWMWKD